MKIKYFGHSTFQIDDLIIDPFIKDNKAASTKVADIKCKIICVTHDHFDHLGDTVEIAKNNNATVVAVGELARSIAAAGVKTEGLGIGGTIRIGSWKIKIVKAVHSSGTGPPVGFVLTNLSSGKKIYHAGDTALFGDMRLIGDEEIDIALIPIGGHYTMDADDALKAVELIRPKLVIPMHYDTFPVIKADALDFKKHCKAKVEIMPAGSEKEF